MVSTVFPALRSVEHRLIVWSVYVLITSLALTGCASQTPPPVSEPSTSKVAAASGRSADALYMVDCLLPGQIRKLGRAMTYLTPRRPIKTSAQDCEIRGGEYVAYDRSDTPPP